MNDQSIKADAGKVQPTLVPVGAIIAIARVRAPADRKITSGLSRGR